MHAEDRPTCRIICESKRFGVFGELLNERIRIAQGTVVGATVIFSANHALTMGMGPPCGVDGMELRKRQ